MSKGSKCPHCGKRAYRDKGSHMQCDDCGYVAWGFSHAVGSVGKGRGNRCPWCGRSTLHDIVTLPKGEIVRRCTTCNYTAIDPSKS